MRQQSDGLIDLSAADHMGPYPETESPAFRKRSCLIKTPERHPGAGFRDDAQEDRDAGRQKLAGCVRV